MSNEASIPAADIEAFIENWRLTLPNREGDPKTAEYILDSLEKHLAAATTDGE